MSVEKSKVNVKAGPPMGFGPRSGPGGGGPGHGMLTAKVKLKDSPKTMKRLLGYLEDKTKLLFLVILISIFSTAMTILGTRINGLVVDRYVIQGDLRGLAMICGLLTVMYLASSLGIFVQSRIMIHVSQNTTAHLRQDLFVKQQRLPIKYFDTHASGDLMSRLTNDIDNISMALSQNLTQFFNGVINVTGILVAMLLLSPYLTVISLVTLPVMFFLTMTLSRFTRKIYGQQQKQMGDLNGYVEETLSGQKAVLLFGREETAKADFAVYNEQLKKSAVWTFIGTGSLGPFMNLINNLTYLIVAVAGGYFVVQGRTTAGVVFSFLLFMRNFARPINELSNLFTTIQGALAGAERVFEVMDERAEQDRPDAVELTGVQGYVRLDDACFAYEPGKPILCHASLEAHPGTMTAIVGPTGAGKTTLISLLAKFYDLDEGHISIDGKDVASLTRDSIRKAIGIVLQDTFLFSESVKDNIRYGRLDATDEEIIEAAKMANAHSFIERLEQGYDTILSDNGDNLSQGQRQLLSIARVILAKPAILVLDEATSSVDTRTELKIQEALLKLMEGRTSFVIAHRLSTIRNADQILVVHDGRIVERGSHQALLQQKGFYAELYNSQFRTGLVE